MTTENLRNTMATLDAMKVANTEMKKQYGKLDVNKIEVSWLLCLLAPGSTVWDFWTYLL